MNNILDRLNAVSNNRWTMNTGIKHNIYLKDGCQMFYGNNNKIDGVFMLGLSMISDEEMKIAKESMLKGENKMRNDKIVEEIKKLVDKMANEDMSVMRGLIQKAINDELDKLGE